MSDHDVGPPEEMYEITDPNRMPRPNGRGPPGCLLDAFLISLLVILALMVIYALSGT